MTATLLAHQLRFDLLALRRNRRMQLFGLALPLVLLVTFAGLFDATPVEVAGHMVPGRPRVRARDHGPGGADVDRSWRWP